jgi:hypothetical protein
MNALVVKVFIMGVLCPQEARGDIGASPNEAVGGVPFGGLTLPMRPRNRPSRRPDVRLDTRRLQIGDGAYEVATPALAGDAHAIRARRIITSSNFKRPDRQAMSGPFRPTPKPLAQRRPT